MTFDEIMRSLKQKKYAPVYLLSGEEPYYIDQITNYIEENVLDESAKDFNLTVLYGRDTKVEQIVNTAKQYPVMSDYQVVMVKEAQVLDKIEALSDYFSKPIPTTILVLAYKYKKVDKRKSFYKQVEKSGVFFESEKIKEGKVSEWIFQYIQGKSYKINQKALALLVESLGVDLSKIVNELDKLMLNIPEQSEITPELIEKYIGISKDYNVFELTKALSEKNIQRANQIIHYFATDPDNPIQKVIPMLYPYFLKLTIYQTEQAHSSPQELLQKMGVRFLSDDYKQGARNYPLSKLVKILGYFREYDAKSKGVDSTPSTTGGDLMKELIFKILH